MPNTIIGRFMPRLIMSLLAVVFFTTEADAQPNEFIRKRVEEIQSGVSDQVKGELVHCRTTLPNFYANRNFELAWNNFSIQELRGILIEAETHGLDPFDYHYGTFLKINNGLGAIEQAEQDLLLTDAFLHYASHLLDGKVNLGIDSTGDVLQVSSRLDQFLEQAIQNPNFSSTMSGLAPSTDEYQRMKEKLRSYRRIEAKGGWKPIPEGNTLKVDMIDWDRVPLIVDRLRISGEVDEDFMRSPEYTKQLSNAIKDFQKQNDLNPDGNVGKLTLVALNRSVGERINDLIIEMEEYRQEHNSLRFQSE